MIYLDTSAMVKLVVRERESEALIERLNAMTDNGFTPAAIQRAASPARIDCCTAQIGRIELMRAALRFDRGAQPAARTPRNVHSGETTLAARRILETFDILISTREIAELAETVNPPDLRTLDALHLATILSHKPALSAVCAYDHRLIAACEHHSIAVIKPGVD